MDILFLTLLIRDKSYQEKVVISGWKVISNVYETRYFELSSSIHRLSLFATIIEAHPSSLQLARPI